ncbi:MAG: hypothetical protein NUV93_09000 [Firmicutes bacterium]|nr:hypothetical protein [Bacillota bacterium]
MSVKPVDLQASVPKSAEVGKYAKMKQDEGQARLTEAARAFQGEMDKLQRQVHTPAKPAAVRVERDRRGEGRRRDSEEPEQDRDKAEDGTGTGDSGGAGTDPRKGGIIDMLF